MTEEPLAISIVIPNLNSGAVLERCLRSLLEQDYPRLQLIMADGGSTDESRETIDAFRDRLDVVLEGPDKGQADGLNKGFRHATGDVMGWLCADDEQLPGALNQVDRELREHPRVDMVTGGCERVFPNGATLGVPADPAALEKIGLQNVIEQPSTFWRRSLHQRLGELDTSYYLGFDWDFWARMRNAGARLRVTSEVLSRYHFSETNKCGQAGDLFTQEAFRLVRTHGPRPAAYLYRFIYRHFDLKGCLDDPVSCSPWRYRAYAATHRLGVRLLGEEVLNMYNWHFAALQARGLKWF